MIDLLRSRVEMHFKNMQHAFRSLDQDHSGALTRDEIERGMVALNIPARAVDQLMRHLDINSDGLISFAEFSAALKPCVRASGTTHDDRFATNRHTIAPNIAGGQLLINDNLPVCGIRGMYRPDASLMSLPQGGGEASAGQLNGYQTAISDLIYSKHGKLRDAFRAIDTNRDGRLSEAELKHAVRTYNLPIPERHVEQLFAQLVDRNRDGQVDYEEFALALKRKDALGH